MSPETLNRELTELVNRTRAFLDKVTADLERMEGQKRDEPASLSIPLRRPYVPPLDEPLLRVVGVRQGADDAGIFLRTARKELARTERR
jgi:hypothetical protein